MFRCILLLLLAVSVAGKTFAQDKAFATSVKQEFKDAWQAYKANAWDSDALKPKTKTGYNVYYQSFYLTALESYSTLVLLQMTKEANEVKEKILTELKFKKYVIVPTGEFGSRVLSALLSAYQQSGDSKFLELAVDLGNRMLPAFDTPTGMPNRLISLASLTGKENNNSPNQIASLIVEFALLSDLTGNPLYFNKAKKATLALWAKRSKDNLIGEKIDVSTGLWVDSETNVSLAISGYFSAVLKAYLLTGDADCKRIWKEGSEAITTHLGYKFNNNSAFRYSNLNKLTESDSLFQYTEILYAGVLAEGGKIDEAESYFEYCKNRIDSLVLSPELINFQNDKKSRYINKLYDEQIEACFMLYQYTQKEAYLSYARTLFEFIKENCKTGNAYSGLSDVRKKTTFDQMPPSFLAKTLKYFYLMAGDHSSDLKSILFTSSGEPLLFPKHE